MLYRSTIGFISDAKVGVVRYMYKDSSIFMFMLTFFDLCILEYIF